MLEKGQVLELDEAERASASRQLRRLGRLSLRALAAEPSVLFLALAVATCVALAEFYSVSNYGNVVDDALISMQYAKHLALGDGLVFNVGERVEGYTNFLWVVFMAPFYAFCKATGVAFVPLMVHVNVLIAALNLVLVYAIGRQLWNKNLIATAVALGLCVVDNSYTVWAALGLEPHFLAFWLLLSILLAGSKFKSRGFGVGLTLAAAQMTRPDAGLFNVCLIAGLGASWLRAVVVHLPVAEKRERLRVAGTALGTWLCVYAAYFAWRYQYYGFLLPNTYYAKVGGGELDAWARGARYVSSFLNQRLWVPLLAILGLLAPTTSVARAVILYLAAHALYVTYVGGDFFPGHRFFVPELPLIGLACGLSVHALSTFLDRGALGAALSRHPRWRIALRTLALAVLAPMLWLLFAIGKWLGPYEHEIQFARDGVQKNRELMLWLASNKSADATFATCSIGTAGFDGQFTRVIDILGLIDPVVAHRPVERFGHGKPGHEKVATLADILSQKPTYIQPEYMPDNFWQHGYYFDANMRLDLGKRVEGVWHRDELAERGEFLSETALHFDPGDHAGWTASGSAFARWPSHERPFNQLPGIGEDGPFIDTFDQEYGDLQTGRLLSPPFELVGEKMVLRVGGGLDLQRLLVALVIDGRRVFVESGLDTEHLSRREWPIGADRGKRAQLEIVDFSEDTRGHIMVDEVIQWRSR